MAPVKVFNTVKVKEFQKQNPTGVASPEVDTTEPHSSNKPLNHVASGSNTVASRRSQNPRNNTQPDSINTPRRKNSGKTMSNRSRLMKKMDLLKVTIPPRDIHQLWLCGGLTTQLACSHFLIVSKIYF